jgi:hypothetical protein
MKKGLIPYVKETAKGADHIHSCHLANSIGYNLIMNTNQMLGEKHRMIGFLHLKAAKKITT